MCLKSKILLIIIAIGLSSTLTHVHGQEKCISENLTLDELDLDTAVYRVFNQSINLHIADETAESMGYQVVQSSLYPNPKFSYEVEDFAGNKLWKGWDHRQERYVFGQLIETAGKRVLRTQVAAYQYYASLVGSDVSKIVTLNQLMRAFIGVASAQEFLQVALDQEKIAKEVLRIATVKVEAGKVSLIQQNKAEVAYSNAVIAVETAKVDFKNAKKRLSLLWANPCADFNKVVFPFYDITSPIPIEQCVANLSNQPEIVQSGFQYLSAEKNWRLAKANRIPDVTVSVGYKVNYREDSHGMLAAVSIPIPLFDRNQGNIGSAYLDMHTVEDQGKQLWIVLQSKLAISHEEVVRAYEEASRIKNKSLPSATEAFELAEKGYREGKFEYLDVLDAQRTLFDVRQRYVQSLILYHTRQADIEYLNSQMD